MGSSNFRVQFIIRILLLSVTIWVAVVLFSTTAFYLTACIITALSAMQVYSLIRFTEVTNRNVSSFLESIRNSDFSRSFQLKDLGSTFNSLETSFNEVIADFQKISDEKERQNHYLENIVHHVSIALIAFDSNGEVSLCNAATKKLFQIPQLDNLSDLNSISSELVSQLHKMKSGEKTRVRLSVSENPLELTIHATSFKQKDLSIKLVSIQDIQAEMEEQELRSWQNLIRVLTHEIMNSITPISSLSNLVIDLIKGIGEHLPASSRDGSLKDSLEDINDALTTIHKRSDGLIEFVQTYRNLTHVPKPNFKVFALSDLLARIKRLKNESFASAGVTLIYEISPESMELTADESLIEQILINLLENATDAVSVSEVKRIQIRGGLNDQGRPVIQVLDSGQGIQPDVLEKIFIPFFTTKPKGSGIGLSLSRQIMRQHGGNISARSTAGKGAVFTLSF